MGEAGRFSRREFQRILDVSDKQLSYWEKLRLVSPQKVGAKKFYDFRDLITLRTAKQLIENGVTAQRLRRSIEALQHQLAEVKSPLTELRIRSNGRDVIIERAGMQMEPISGQIMLNFETRELQEKVRVMPHRDASAWVALGVEREQNEAETGLAIEAYERALSMDPGHVDALNNLGMLSYELGNMEEATSLFTRAVELHPHHMLSHFNLGSVSEETGDLHKARQHLRIAVRLDSRNADAQYNLAFVCDKMGAYVEARRHWRLYLKLDPDSKWSEYARMRLLQKKL